MYTDIRAMEERRSRVCEFQKFLVKGIRHFDLRSTPATLQRPRFFLTGVESHNPRK